MSDGQKKPDGAVPLVGGAVFDRELYGDGDGAFGKYVVDEEEAQDDDYR